MFTSDAETEYRLHFEFGDSRTEDVQLVFTTPPTLVNMQTELSYPAYTRLLPRSLEGMQQRLLGLPGTRMTLGFTFSKELQEAYFTWEGDETRLPLEVVGRYATVNLLHREIVPALEASEFERFSETLHEYNRLAGVAFEGEQGGLYVSPVVTKIMGVVRDLGFPGVGQSSWGPTVFAFAPDETSAERLTDLIWDRFAGLKSTEVTAAALTGAVVVRS